MMNTSKNQFNISRGTVIHGKWHKQAYLVERMIGQGAAGTVYLVNGASGAAALKFSNPLSITAEMNVLKAFAKVQGSSLGPSLLDADDWESSWGVHPFYVMEYIQGPTLSDFVQARGTSWIGVLLLQLLENLQTLHEAGWIFGDIKPDNLIVSGPPYALRCVDVGGTTKMGRAVKEYTEFFDRGYWRAGSRKAEPSYDLFAAAMVAINLAYPQRFGRSEAGVKQLEEKVRQKKELEAMAPVLIKSLQGKYADAGTMRKELLAALSSEAKKSEPAKRRSPSRQSSGRASLQQQKRKRQGLYTVTLILFVAVVYVLYVLTELLV
ncbi:protein kinase domain-containing protein [Pseudobacillus badius]|uniref:protein kinase domain-containing protein n=1 Tax=Bacillus badius TaxID=1455 RepID=UPI0007B0A9DC|nr:serine/threonine protein kinase [Bacillus badius]KZO00975.1 serine/threonine protein kinase [Bacillus badius]MED0667626.1 protein kinase family protein [Bacillus badius]OCS89000.1 serine/threonine protein kinase [Bacillus badius]OVE48504.1 serine/threonine protein kinase [Bacillus badius]UAT30799.1 protein kinase family protein [Bacillus badius]